jgi:hypothetical protein
MSILSSGLRTSLLFPVVIFLLMLNACTSLNTKRDYMASKEYMVHGEVANALDMLPKNEKGTFISIMEKTYLNLLLGNPDIDELFAYSKKIDNQVRYKISKDVKSLFYIETPEGYYASEHEIVWMHMLLSWGFSMRGQYDEARVEAKYASILLSSTWSPEGHFDDPFIRAFLGCLWTMAGDWEEARVDFRKAAKLDANMQWARALADLDVRPESIVVVLGGVGPEPEWEGNRHSGIRGLRELSFTGQGKKSTLFIATATSNKSIMHVTSDSSHWYVRHLERESELSELIKDTRYGVKAVGSVTKGVFIIGAGIVGGLAIMAGGVGLGGLIIYLGAKGGSGGVIGLGLVVAGAGITGGSKVIGNATDYAKEQVHDDLDESDSYRYVRFLPEYSWFNWYRKPGVSPLKLYKYAENEPILEIDPHKKNIHGVQILFVPDY